jgi:phage tail-like protein
MSETKKKINSIDTRGTIETDPLRNFRFRAKFTPVGANGVFNKAITSFSGGFSGITGLQITTEPLAYREGGYNTTAHQIPGQTRFENITFSRGALFGNDSALTWMRGLFAVTSGEGLQVSDSGKSSFRCNVTIEVMDHPQSNTVNNKPRMGFYIHNAWITNLRYTDLDAGSQGGIMYESMTLVHEGLSVAFLDYDGSVHSGSVKPKGF